MTIEQQVRNKAMEAIVVIRYVAGDLIRDLQEWDREVDTPEVRTGMVAFELADIQMRERGE